ncbi:MAG: hypothetical protein R3B84_07585 [Zavarzinella sp.]
MEKPGYNKQLSLAFATGSTLSGGVITGLLIDWATGLLPWFTIVGVLLGMGSMFVLLIRYSNLPDSKQDGKQ